MGGAEMDKTLRYNLNVALNRLLTPQREIESEEEVEKDENYQQESMEIRDDD